MNEITKHYLFAFTPIILVVLIMIITPKEIYSFSVLFSTLIFLLFVVAFINIFVQIHKFDKKVAKDPQLKKIVNQKLSPWKRRSTWITLIILLIIWLQILAEYYNLISYLKLGIILSLIAILYFILKKLKVWNNLLNLG